MRKHLSYLFHISTEEFEINNEQLFLANQIFSWHEDFCKNDLENKQCDLNYIKRERFDWKLVDNIEFNRSHGKRF